MPRTNRGGWGCWGGIASWEKEKIQKKKDERTLAVEQEQQREQVYTAIQISSSHYINRRKK
jgi:hypothetical protein